MQILQSYRRPSSEWETGGWDPPGDSDAGQSLRTAGLGSRIYLTPTVKSRISLHSKRQYAKFLNAEPACRAFLLGNGRHPQWLYQPQWRWFPHRPRCPCAHCRSVDHRGDQVPGGRQEEKTNHPVKRACPGPTVQSLFLWSVSHYLPTRMQVPTKAKERPELGSISRDTQRKTRGTRPAQPQDVY